MNKKGPWITCTELEERCEEVQTIVARLTEGRDQLHAREMRAREPPGACRGVKEAAEAQLRVLRQRKAKLEQRREVAEQEAEQLGEGCGRSRDARTPQWPAGGGGNRSLRKQGRRLRGWRRLFRTCRSLCTPKEQLVRTPSLSRAHDISHNLHGSYDTAQVHPPTCFLC